MYVQCTCRETIILPEFSDSLYFKCAALKKKLVKIFCVESCRKCDKPSNCLLFLSEGEFVIILLRIIYLLDRFYRKLLFIQFEFYPLFSLTYKVMRQTKLFL